MTTAPTPDSIERQIDIAADAQRVFALISRPGWWINEGTIVDNVLEVDGDVTTVTHEKYGRFRIRTVERRPPHYVSFRWLGGDTKNEALEVPGTLVEFFVEERKGGVTLRVLESGFSTLPVTDEERRKNVADNTEGWEQELVAARTFIDGA